MIGIINLQYRYIGQVGKQDGIKGNLLAKRCRKLNFSYAKSYRKLNWLGLTDKNAIMPLNCSMIKINYYLKYIYIHCVMFS